MGLIGAIAAQAHEPITTKLTWTQEISRIIYKRCASCHHEGGTAFSLINYDEARPWAKAIREEVLERRMPPWGAVEGVGAFRDNPSLTPLEIEMLVSWVEGGAPEGDAIYLPPKPVFDASPKSVEAPKPLLTVESTAPLTLREPVTPIAIAPRDMPNGSSMEVTAYKPDGSVEHLIWLRNYREEWTRTYWFRDPVRLPAGTRIVVDAIAPAAVAISLGR
ncbi:MAG TPA: cytochrome c [Bryobacteraceae bacterium]|nr:cytochrome c [Bryobacteraceae bacterium]